MNPDLDLTVRAWTKDTRGLTAIGTWIRIEGRFRPCMVLIRAGSEYSDRTVPCVITMDRAFVWYEDPAIGNPYEAALIACQFLEVLQAPVDQRNVRNLITVVNDLLGDLLSIPPYPEQQLDRPVVAEVVLTDNVTGRTVETEIRDV